MSQKAKDIKKDWAAVAEKTPDQSHDKRDKAEKPEKFDLDTETEQAWDEEASLEHPSYEQLQAQLTETEAKVHEYWEQLMRTQADNENLKRRAQRDLENAHKFAIEKFATELLPLLDSLEHALSACEAADEGKQTIKEGLDLTHKLFIDTLAKFNIKVLDPIKQSFDPNLHEAMSTQVDDTVEPNTVLLVVQKGYQLYDRLIRPARVIVSKQS